MKDCAAAGCSGLQMCHSNSENEDCDANIFISIIHESHHNLLFFISVITLYSMTIVKIEQVSYSFS